MERVTRDRKPRQIIEGQPEGIIIRGKRRKTYLDGTEEIVRKSGTGGLELRKIVSEIIKLEKMDQDSLDAVMNK